MAFLLGSFKEAAKSWMRLGPFISPVLVDAEKFVTYSAAVGTEIRRRHDYRDPLLCPRVFVRGLRDTIAYCSFSGLPDNPNQQLVVV